MIRIQRNHLDAKSEVATLSPVIVADATAPAVIATHSFESISIEPPSPQQDTGCVQRASVELSFSSPDDPSEQAANQAADQFLSGTLVSTTTHHRSSKLERCEACNAKPFEDKCESCQQASLAEGESLQRSGTSHGAAQRQVSPEVLNPTGGQALSDEVRRPFETHFGHDFSRIRIHADERAAELAASVDARAYASGTNIVFGSGHFAPQEQSGRWLLAHELTHTIQQGAVPALTNAQQAPIGSDSSGKSLQRDPLSTPTVPATAPAANGAQGSVPYTGQTLSPVTQGMSLTANPEQIHALLRQMIVEHGEEAMSSWVSGLEGVLMAGNTPKQQSDRQVYGGGDVSGAADPSSDDKQRVIRAFQVDRDRWRMLIADIKKRFDSEVSHVVTELLDVSEGQISEQAIKNGIALNPAGGNRQAAVDFLPIPKERQNLKDAAKELLEEWNKKDQAKKTAQALLTPPWDLVKFEEDFALRRRATVAQFPALAPFSREKSKLVELVSQRDPAGNLAHDMEERLTNIAWVRSKIEDRKPQLKLDSRVRGAAKKGLLAAPNSVEGRVIDDEVKGIVADQEMNEKLKSILGVTLLVASFVPGLQVGAAVVGVGVMGADVVGKWQDHLWDEAASGTAFERAMAISQTEPSLFKLGLEIALGITQGVVEVIVIGKAIETFKLLSSVVHEAVAARTAARVARTVATSEAAAESLVRLELEGNARGNELGKRLKQAVERGELGGEKEALPIDATPKTAGDSKPFNGKKTTGLPDALNPGETHSITITRNGNIRCSGVCADLAQSLQTRAAELGEGLREENRARVSGLISEAQAAKVEATSVAEGSPEEAALMGKLERIEKNMVDIERDVGSVLRKRLGISRDYTGELSGLKDRVRTLRENHQGKPGYGEMQKRCDNLANKIDDTRSQFTRIQNELELAGQAGRPSDPQRDATNKLLDSIPALDKDVGSLEREQRSQLQALNEGGKLYGKSDQEIRDRLQKKLGRGNDLGNIADLVARKPDGSWLVTESKGGNVDDAFRQLQNTVHLLKQAEPTSVGRIELRMTVTPEAMTALETGGQQGYGVKNGLLFELASGKPTPIEGIQVRVQSF